ncbi:MAG: hypothetical protein WBW48_01375 [Anaerolineae bacterium]
MREKPWVELVETARRDTSTGSVQVCAGLSGNWQSYRDGNPVNGQAYQKERGNDDGEYL